MKRIANIILCLVILFSLVACKKDENVEIEPPLPISTIEKEEIKEEQEVQETITKPEEQEEKIEEEIDYTNMYYWVDFFDDKGNCLDRYELYYGETPTYKGKDPSYVDGHYYKNFVSWTDKDGNIIDKFEPIHTNTYFYAKYNTSQFPKYTITTGVVFNDDSQGSVTGAGEYYEGDVATLTAVPNAGYIFASWSDGDTNNPRRVTVSGDKKYKAQFTRPFGIYSDEQGYYLWNDVVYSFLSNGVNADNVTNEYIGVYSIEEFKDESSDIYKKVLKGIDGTIYYNESITQFGVFPLGNSKVTNVYLPTHLTDAGYGLCEGEYDGVRNIYVPNREIANIQYAKIFGNNSKINFIIDEDNEYYKYEGSMFMSMDNKLLINDNGPYPEHLAIPEGVESFHCYIGSFSENIKRLTLPSSIKSIQGMSFQISNLTEVIYDDVTYTDYLELKQALENNGVVIGDLAFEHSGLTNCPTSCVSGETLITLEDGGQKMIKEMDGSEIVKTYNPFTGNFENREIIGLYHHEDGGHEVMKLTFASGKQVELILKHHLLNKSKQEYSLFTKYTMNNYIGDEFLLDDGSYDELIDVELINKETGSYSIISAYDESFIINGFVSVTGSMPANKFKMNSNLVFDQEEIEKETNEYGLYTYADFADYMSEDLFNKLNGPIYKILINKGVLTSNQLYCLIDVLGKDGID